MDYTEIFNAFATSLECVCQQLQCVCQQLTIQNQLISDQNEILGDMRDDIRVIKHRAETSSLGIYQNHVCNTCGDDRALVMNALKETGMIDDVLDEWGSPTPPSNFFKTNG